MSTLRWPSKDPQDTLDYSLDWKKELSRIGDSIFESYWRIESDDEDPVALVTTSDGINAYITYIWLVGGTANAVYRIVNTIHTSAGRIYERTVLLPVAHS